MSIGFMEISNQPARPLADTENLTARFGEQAQKIAGQPACVAEVAAEQLTGRRMEIDTRGGSLDRWHALRQESTDCPGEDVAGSGRGKRRVGKRRYHCRPFGRRDDSMGALQHDDLLPLPSASDRV